MNGASLLIGMMFWVGLMIGGDSFDLPLSMAVANPKSRYGLLVSQLGELFPWGLILISVIYLGRKRYQTTKLQKYRPLAWAIIIEAIICPLVITQTLKYCWGRVRFIHLAPGYFDYTPFYIPAKMGGGESFPSGHVSMAFVGSPIPFFFFAKNNRVAAAVSTLLVLIYGIGVSWGRIVFGRHYLTDCIFSMGLALIVAAVLIRRLLLESKSHCPPD